MHPKVIIGFPEWELSGVSVFAAHLARGLKAKGWDARILITRSLQWGATETRPTPFELPSDIQVDHLPVNPGDYWDMRWDALIRYLEEQAPCIYLPNYDWRMSVVSARLSDRVGIIGVLHTDLPVDYDHFKRLSRYWNATVCVSETIRYNALFSLPQLAPSLVTIPYGIPVTEKPPARSETGILRLIYHGALRHGQKRVFDLIRIAEGLTQHGIPFELTIVGDGPARPELEEKAQPLIQHGTVRIIDTMGNAELLGYLEHQDIFLLPSEYEGLPLALLEAMGKGCVPITSDLPTLTQIIQNGVNGYRVPVGMCDLFVERLVELVQHSERRRAMAVQAYQTIVSGGYRVQDMVESYASLFEKVGEDIRLGIFRRSREEMQTPPGQVGVAHILPGNHSPAASMVNSGAFWPNPLHRPAPNPPPRIMRSSRNLEDYQVIFGTVSGHISGVDVFAFNLAKQLNAQGIKSSIMFTLRGRKSSNIFSKLPTDVPVERLPGDAFTDWPQRWRTAIKFLETRAPCIYIPNYDWWYSCVSPKLSDQVKVIGIAHSDDPQHYEHVAQLGRFWDGIIGVSNTITRHITGLDPSLTPRLHTIPYGVPTPPTQPVRPRRPDGKLRIVYAGRVLRYQKRILDVLHIARALVARNVPFELIVVGNGNDYDLLAEAGQDLLARFHLRLVGQLSNDNTKHILANSDVFLLTSSFEGMPVSLLEAMAQGCIPVVSRLRSGIPEILRDGENGFTVPVADIEQFVARLESLAHNSALRQQMSEAAYQTICNEGYRLEEMTEQYIQLFREVLIQDYIRPSGPIKPPPNLKYRGTLIEWVPPPLRRVFWAMRRLVKGRD
jgi:glycosyltransferase involved in cell wall biosynthesis